ncbi:hypothetical protein CRUP_016945, partial [Coryphaenoides rupestris]
VQEPYAVVVLLEKDFIVVDLTQSNFPIFENPYPMDIHESPGVANHWGNLECGLSDVPRDHHHRTSKVFEKPKPGEVRGGDLLEEDPYAVQMVSWCPQSRVFCVSLEVRLQCDVEEVMSPSEMENHPCFPEPGSQSPQPASPGSGAVEGERPMRVPPGYQAELVVQLLWVDGEPPQQITRGLSYDKAGRRPTLTIMHGKAITNTCGRGGGGGGRFPIFENPYPMDIHESPVTCTAYFADCPPDIIPILYSIGAKHKKAGFSQKEWPITGGTWNVGSQTYPEIIITGHADGSIKFWDASA